MSKYETTVRLNQIQKLVEERKYKKAAAVLETLDVRQIKTRQDLQRFAEIYVKTEQFEAAKAIYLRIYKKNRNKKTLYRLLYLAIRTNHLDEAEDFYQEFLHLNHSEQESLILRYRIDKAKGAPFERLIDTLEQLKEEDYIEEWAYELAKLYQRAGRIEECRRECEDIKLWFGEGEIVEHAEHLLEYLSGDQGVDYEDRDYTVEKPEPPNPDDTGSLPALDEFVEEEETTQAEETPAKGKGGFGKLKSFWKRGDKESKEGQEAKEEKVEPEEKKEAEKKETENGSALEQTADQSVQTQETVEEDKAPEEAAAALTEPSNKWTAPKPSQSGMGITQDLAKEITAIFEAERREQLREKAVAVVDDATGKIGDVPNLASDVLGRMTHAVQSKVGKQYIPMDVDSDIDFVEETDTIAEVQRPAGMEEIVTSGVLPANEDEVTMIELDQIMPEPDIPELKQVMPEDSPELGNLPELEENELPTTKALHHSLDDLLTLIGGELEPKHFVLMGQEEEKILGITKKIVQVNYKKGFLSTKQIARIHSQQLNDMDLLRVCSQIKGSCLLIDEAAGLSFPTITKIFAVMDAFRGDFTVVLADDGDTLDELFRVAPALARRFEYVIDVSQYSEEDYQ